MKTNKLVFVLLITPLVLRAQEIGINLNVGYSNWNMEQVNDYLDNSEFVNYEGYYFIRDENSRIGQPLSFELGVSLELSSLVIGISGTYQSKDGSWESWDTIRTINHNMGISSFEILPLLGH